MILAFARKWGKEMPVELIGRPTFFIEKIWESLFRMDYPNCETLFHEYFVAYNEKFEAMWDEVPDDSIRMEYGKCHSIRKGDRWNEGMKIHPVINNRTKDVFQFAPTLHASFVQDIFMTTQSGLLEITIDEDKYLYHNEKETLAKRDGFDTLTDFESYFISQIEQSEKKCFSGQIIHWTNFKY